MSQSTIMPWRLLTMALATAGMFPGVEAQNNHWNASSAALANIASPLACTSGLREFNPQIHKSVYRVGVHAIRGFEAAQNEYTMIFQDYLTATAGQRFNPPVKFEMVPTTFQGLFDAAEKEEIDFFLANPGIYSCVGVEVGAQPLVTIIARLDVRGRTYDLDVFSGVMATQKNNREIETIHDLKDKVIAAGGISMILAGQVQFFEMERAGMSYVMDPKQLVFTGNQFDVVKGVLRGDFDVGFVRTDQIERTRDDNGEFVNPDDFKIISPRIHILEDGNLFPFLHSTDMYPEWPVASLTHVPRDVAEEVQQALLAVGKHANIGKAYEDCQAELFGDTCEGLPPNYFDPSARCDTTYDLAQLAWEASKVGHFAGFRTSRSYFEPRTMHEAGGFMAKDDNGDWRCTRAATLYDGIKCPAGHVKRSEAEFEQGCQQVNLTCHEGYDCFCRPCVYEVDLYEFVEGEEDVHLGDQFSPYPGGCDKMSLCGTVQQTETITFRAFDNKRRPDCEVRAVVQNGMTARDVEVTRIGSWAYEFSFEVGRLGEVLVDVYIDGQQIPVSPIRVEVVERACGGDRVASAYGKCVCVEGTLAILDTCIASSVFFVSVSTVLILAAVGMGVWYLNYKRHQSDQMWHIAEDELHMDEPPTVIGQGSFGVVLLAEYRGTKVAIKQVLQRREGMDRSRSSIKYRVSDSRESIRLTREDSNATPPDSEQTDLESPAETLGAAATEARNSYDSLGSIENLFHIRPGRSKWARFLRTWFYGRTEAHLKKTFGSTNGTTDEADSSRFCLCFDAGSRKKNEFIQEMRLLSRLRHPNITTVMGAVISRYQQPMLVMEYMEYGSLYDLLRNETAGLGGEIILQIIRDIAQGIRYLHASKPPILHGDLKAKNILIDSRFRAKVCDFGLSEKKKNSLSGSPFWLAPEYLRGRSDYTTHCDMFSVGIILYEIYSRKLPYEGENLRKVLQEVMDSRKNKRPNVPPTCPPKMTNIMKRCWSPDPMFRPQAQDLDLLLMDVNVQEAEPLMANSGGRDQQGKQGRSAEKRPTGDMMYQIFPKHIADALKAGQKVEPEQHELVTVFFSDIVHFTDISRTLSPLKVSSLLDRLYLLFDTLARKHGVFKVETIGDAYMGVTNLDGSQDNDHVKRIAQFSMEVVEAAGQVQIDKDDPERGCVKIRVGFHSGPVVSNVIGSLNPRYGLFGDTVNTAARMESNSYSGRIHCSERAALLLADQAPQIRTVRRGEIDIKGKGQMVTYWVRRPKDGTATPAGSLESVKEFLLENNPPPPSPPSPFPVPSKMNLDDSTLLVDTALRPPPPIRMDLFDKSGETTLETATDTSTVETSPPPTMATAQLLEEEQGAEKLEI